MIEQLLIGCCVAALLVWLNGRRKSWPGAPPSPFRLPFLGNLNWLSMSTIFTSVMDLHKKFGPIVLLKLGDKDVVVVASREIHKEMYGDKTRIFSERGKTLGAVVYSRFADGLAYANNPDYIAYRKFLHSTILSAASLRPNIHAINQELSHALRYFDRFARDGSVCDFEKTMFDVNMNVVGRICFGQRFVDNIGGDINNPLYQAISDVFEGCKFNLADFFSFLKPFTTMDKIEKANIFVEEWTNKIYDAHIALNREQPEDLVDYIIQKMKNENSEGEKKNLLKIVTDILMAGGETVSTTLAWAIYTLASHPKVATKLQAELDATFGAPTETPISPKFEEVSDLPYLTAVIKESSRANPVLVFPLNRRATEDTTLAGYQIKKGTWVWLNTWYLWRSEQYWKNPDAFIPERWIPGAPEFEENTTLPYLTEPFGKGVRNCIGETLAWQELMICTAVLLHRYNFKVPKNFKAEPELVLVVRPKGGSLPLHINKRY